ncbi:MAG: ADP-ribosyl-[dinitrogen reductase] hydrolase [Lamprocystis purpurea]|jgi:ADP-ribosyl-[dinitrogen reductase] hydrolase|uniref:ADP-ribosyl-[dinitrogen reductase] hydrolase n=1 Tax=Lamprocystis purpurea TaxID=61598 RepID=UPI000374F26B|nr:ADP-ribosyl-[dinitrogen reductase] hydrolase [Lamprocystis purpurea]MBV5276051.1 ADP-ribosyl-[dinitrogen reductase] hydrolase [Lamprocystis purpurea]
MFVLELTADLSGSECSADALQARAVGAYVGMAVGDALGATVEFLTPREIHEQFGIHQDIRGGGWLRLRKGQVTDDTEMSLALGTAILAEGRVEAGAVAAAFSEWMRGKPVDIGHTVRRGISQYRLTGATQMPENDYDAGNGACMRSLPIALCTLGAESSLVAQANRIQSHTTHHSAVGDTGTLTVIRMVQAALLGGDMGHLKGLAEALVAEQPLYRYDRRRMENPGGFLVETLRAVFQALFATDTFEGALIDVVNRGGDADTTGAILGMIAGALYGYDAIPRRWLTALEPKAAIACRDQARALLRMSPHCMMK